ncbi:MAG: response regulator [Candidatus Riflebacteria bacterium]|nr:response regulator [Candidatus Riflebacteria bacterium]
MRQFNFSEIIYLSEIEKTLRLLSELFSISIGIFNNDGESIFSNSELLCPSVFKPGSNNNSDCFLCNGKINLIDHTKKPSPACEPFHTRCQKGFHHIVSPIFFQDSRQANLVFSYFLTEDDECKLPDIKHYFEINMCDIDKLCSKIHNFPVFSSEKINLLSNLCQSLAQDFSIRASRNMRLINETRGHIHSRSLLKDSRESLDNFLNASSIVSYEHSFLTGEMKTNGKWAEMLEYSNDSYPKTVAAWKENIHPSDLSDTIKNFNDHISGVTNIFEGIYRFQSRNGKWKWFLDRGKIISRDEHGKALSMLGARIEISQLKATQNDQFQAKLTLDEVQQIKERFLANVTHEVRTPLNGIIGMTGLLLDSELDQKQHQYADTIRKSSEALLSLMNDLLDFSNFETGTVELEQFSFDIRNMIEDIAEMLAAKVHRKGLELNCRVNSNVPAMVEGDPGRIRQTLTCLVDNSIKFTDEGEISIFVRLENEDEKVASINFSITDTGLGVPLEKQEFLFQTFSQIDPSSTRRYGGMGMGLSLALGIVKRMNGKMGYEKLDKGGSNFWFTIPLKKVPIADSHQPFSELPDNLKDVRILLIDDNVTSRQILMEMLSGWKCFCDNADSGKSGIEALETSLGNGNPYNIAILDMVLGDTTGEAIGKFIRSNRGFDNTKIILLTSLSMRGDVKRVKEIGFNGYLTKPVKKALLFDCLLSVLRDHKPLIPGEQNIVTRHSLAEKRKHKARILVAEDNPTNQKVALGILEKLGFRADAVANGIEAIRALSTIPYDLVFMDLQMPDMDGIEATSLIRQKNSPVINHEVPVIAMTAHALKGNREECLEVGMNDYISKPVSPNEIMNAIKKYLFLEQEEFPEKESLKDKQISDLLIFDKNTLFERLGEDNQLCSQVINVFISDAPKQIASILDAIEQNNLEQVLLRSHTLKGASANVCAVSLNNLISKIEAAAKSDDIFEVRALSARLDDEIKQFTETATGTKR